MEPKAINPEMIVALAPGLAATRRRRIREKLESVGAIVSMVEGSERHYFELRGEIAALQTLSIDSWPGVAKVMVLGESAMHWAPDKAMDCAPIQVGNHAVGVGELTIIAGPCAIEEEERALRIAERVGATGADLFRGGAYKPRTSPYAFQGLGADALPILEQVRHQTGLGIITEVLDARDVERVSQVADMLQVGSRNMHNYSLLKELGQASTPVLLKRGFASTIDEWLMAAEYILNASPICFRLFVQLIFLADFLALGAAAIKRKRINMQNGRINIIGITGSPFLFPATLSFIKVLPY
jgi:3-deoxy-7-phosphoheptulonate synthase